MRGVVSREDVKPYFLKLNGQKKALYITSLLQNEYREVTRQKNVNKQFWRKVKYNIMYYHIEFKMVSNKLCYLKLNYK